MSHLRVVVPEPETVDPGLGRDFRLYALGRGVSTIGDRIAVIAMVFLVIRLTHGYAPAVSLFFVVQLVPSVLGGTVAGVVADQVDRRRLMIACDLTRAVLLVTVALLSTVALWSVYVAIFFLYGLSILFDTAARASLPDVVDERRMTDANSVLNGISKFADLFYAVGGALVFALQVRLPFLIDAATFLFSAAMISGMRIPRQASARLHGIGDAIDSVRAGIAYVIGEPFLKWSALAFAFSAFGGGVAFVLAPLYANQTLAHGPYLVGPLHSGAFRFSLTEVALGLGAIVGSTIVAWLARRWPRGILTALGIAGLGGLTVLLSLTSNVYVACCLFFLTGAFNSIFIVAGITLVQQLAPTEMRGRVMAANSTVTYAALAAGSACSGLLLQAFPYDQLWVLVGVIIFTGSLFIWLRPDVRSLA